MKIELRHAVAPAALPRAAFHIAERLRDMLAASAELSSAAEEVALADFDARMAQDAVRDRRMEIEIRQREVDQVLLAGERHRVLRPDRKGDILALGAVDLLALHA